MTNFFNMDISLGTCFPKMIFFKAGHEILLEGSVSQIFDLGLCFFFVKKRVTFDNFLKLFFPDCIK